jgi:hypothetical protein
VGLRRLGVMDKSQVLQCENGKVNKEDVGGPLGSPFEGLMTDHYSKH